MGGGKTKENRNYYTTLQQQQNAALSTPTQGEAIISKDVTDWNNWMNSPGKDVRDAPGMSPYIQIGQAAMDRAAKETHGNGALDLAQEGSSGYAQQLKELKKNEMGREVGAGLEKAFAMRNAEVKGSVLPLAQLEMGRKMGQLNNTSQMAQTWIQKPRLSWWDHLSNGIGMASQVGGMLFGA